MLGGVGGVGVPNRLSPIRLNNPGEGLASGDAEVPFDETGLDAVFAVGPGEVPGPAGGVPAFAGEETAGGLGEFSGCGLAGAAVVWV